MTYKRVRPMGKIRKVAYFTIEFSQNSEILNNCSRFTVKNIDDLLVTVPRYWLGEIVSAPECG